MVSGLNKITIIGNLGRDPEIRHTQNGTTVCNMSVGVTEQRKEGNEWINHTEWFNIVCFKKTAENAARFLKKGRQIYVDGKIQSKKWQDRNGNQRTSYEIITNQIIFLSQSNRDLEKSKEKLFTQDSSINSIQESINKDSNLTELNNDNDIPF